MAEKLIKEIKELESELESHLPDRDSFLKQLKHATDLLLNLDQCPPTELLNHLHKDVKLLVAACLCEITRITAPETPYSDVIMKDSVVPDSQVKGMPFFRVLSRCVTKSVEDSEDITISCMDMVVQFTRLPSLTLESSNKNYSKSSFFSTANTFFPPRTS